MFDHDFPGGTALVLISSTVLKNNAWELTAPVLLVRWRTKVTKCDYSSSSKPTRNFHIGSFILVLLLIPPFRTRWATSHVCCNSLFFLISHFIRFQFYEQPDFEFLDLLEERDLKKINWQIWRKNQKKKRVEGGHWARAEREVCNNFLQLHASSSSVFLSERRAETKKSGTGCRLSNVWSWEMGMLLFYFTYMSKYIYQP